MGIEIHDRNGKLKPKGDVDHYIPKADQPDLVYVWENYIWSCHSCNQEKGDYYDPECLLFNPCDPKDMAYLEMIREGAQYQLKKEFAQDPLLQERWKKTKNLTMVNGEKTSALRLKILDCLETSVRDLQKKYREYKKLTDKAPQKSKDIRQKRLQMSYQSYLKESQFSSFRKMIWNVTQEIKTEDPHFDSMIQFCSQF